MKSANVQETVRRVRENPQVYRRALCSRAGCPLIGLVNHRILEKKPYWDERGRFHGCPEDWPEQWWDAWYDWWLG